VRPSAAGGPSGAARGKLWRWQPAS
jgi:hypothetical protein